MAVGLDCMDPGAVQDWELEAYADGEELAHVAEHLKQCPACRVWLAEHLAFERHLRQALYRFDCPPPDLLRDYYWGYLPSDEADEAGADGGTSAYTRYTRQRVEAHLATCSHCAAELADLARFVAADRTESSSTLLARARQAAAQARLVVAQLVSPGPSPVPALRGQTRDVLLFDAEGVALSVNLEQECTGAYTLFGQVLSPERVTLAGGYARLTVREEGIDPVQSPLDANGGFALPNLRPGIYQLVVCLPDRRIVVPTLALKAEP